MEDNYVGCLGDGVGNIQEELAAFGYVPVFSDGKFFLFGDVSEKGGVTTHFWHGGMMLMQGSVHSCSGQSALNFSAVTLTEQYLRVGESFFDSIDGSYSLVLWNSEKKRLFLSRDDYGTKLLYYFQDAKGLVWFSNNLNE